MNASFVVFDHEFQRARHDAIERAAHTLYHMVRVRFQVCNEIRDVWRERGGCSVVHSQHPRVRVEMHRLCSDLSSLRLDQGGHQAQESHHIYFLLFRPLCPCSQGLLRLPLLSS